MFSGAELLPPFSIQLTSDGRLGRTPLQGAHKAPFEDSGEPRVDGLSFANMEIAAYRSALAQTDGNVSAAARLLKISRAQLDYRLRRLGLTR